MVEPMHPFDLISLTLAANGHMVAGRTTLQKLIYFETITIRQIRLKEPYVAYFYGPFHRGVANSLGWLVSYGMVDEHMVRGNHDGYVYSVTDKGMPIVDRLASEFKPILVRIKDLIDKCNRHCKLNANTLSFAAKVHYMLNSQPVYGELSDGKLAKQARSFGWEITQSEIKRGKKLLENLDVQAP